MSRGAPGTPRSGDAERRPATDWLFARQRFGARPGLDRTNRLLDALGRPERAFRTVLVAGTNGKGATTGALAAMLDAAGETCGRFVSPHLSRPGERIVVRGRPASDARFEQLAAAVRPHAEAHDATFFETVLAMACLAFAEAGCRTAVLEVGLGGRLDATNALSPVLSIVTNVDLDHTAVLGPDVPSIAREKAGILRRGRPAWTAAEGAALATIRAEAARIGAVLHRLAPEAAADEAEAAFRTTSHGWDGIEVEATTAGERIVLRSPLLGRHQGPNLALAALAARALAVPVEAVRTGAASFVWPGRLEAIDAAAAGFGGLRVLLDGAHNPAAAAALASALRDLGARPHLVYGSSTDKDVPRVLAELAPAVASVRLTRARTSPRAAAPARLVDAARAAGAPVAGAQEVPTEALRAAAAEAARDGAPVLVAGSLYLVGEVRPWLLGEAVPTRERRQ